MLYEQENIQEPNYKELIITKLAYERCERYISCARALIHMHEDEGEENRPEHKRFFKNLWHILDLVSVEIDALTEQLDDK